jgi:hypothetical protein
MLHNSGDLECQSKANQSCMPRQNRVTPFSKLIVSEARGTLTGNRGCLHTDQGEIRRHFLGKRWIICLLEFKDRQREIMAPGRYTELFFLDEATALAAGHRPCAECQRSRFNLFREKWARANPELSSDVPPAATFIDHHLHLERTAPGIQSGTIGDTMKGFPDGTFITPDESNAYLVFQNDLLHWGPAGYQPARGINLQDPVHVLTPLSTIRTLALGYPVNIHSSAFRSD